MIIMPAFVSCGKSKHKWRRLNSRTSYKTPFRWVVNDPFREGDVYWNYLWCRMFPPKDTFVALFKSRPADQNQFFAMLGPKEYFDANLKNYLTKFDYDPLVHEIKKYYFPTADSVEITLYTANSKPRRMDTEDVTYILGYADLGDEMFVIDGGGRSARFDIDLVAEFIESFDLGR